MSVPNRDWRKTYLPVRTGQRVNSRVPVIVEWNNGGRTLRKRGYTLNVSRSGCLAVVPQDLALDQRLRLINLANQQSLEAIIIWKGEEHPEGWELGLQLVNPETDFWDLGF